MTKRWCFVFLAFFLFAGCMLRRKEPRLHNTEGFVTTASGLRYKIVQKGEGAPARPGQEVLLFETTTYLNGTVLYSNETSPRPIKVRIGGNQATPAVDEGLRGMQAGEVRRLIAPPHLVKRSSYPPNVSPDSTLAIKLILHKIL